MGHEFIDRIQNSATGVTTESPKAKKGPFHKRKKAKRDLVSFDFEDDETDETVNYDNTDASVIEQPSSRFPTLDSKVRYMNKAMKNEMPQSQNDVSAKHNVDRESKEKEVLLLILDNFETLNIEEFFETNTNTHITLFRLFVYASYHNQAKNFAQASEGDLHIVHYKEVLRKLMNVRELDYNLDDKFTKNGYIEQDNTFVECRQVKSIEIPSLVLKRLDIVDIG
ncbi:Piso0_005743 [Millerozyma farinosa CBS 7064]|uniref:Piso0_005743 protein n=1 Tax=Pichia sorbitophila (strain ATCC MYA-4447 / BCRC 22081 / CBS 7064 / NBRC 10061 / NRRL Y-12695) TaxID=559304 RepID=G8Y2T2_PICSO|nr:Piso0_005743 [Millerozyma farinosa CBS 7064]